MSITRRALIKSSVALSAVVSTTGGQGLAATPPSLVVYDSRLPHARAFAKTHAAPRIDVAHEDAAFWRALRADVPGGTITGLTSWSDWVTVRGLLEEQGKRVKSEVAEHGLFRWTMG
jgi:hypothetical protein